MAKPGRNTVMTRIGYYCLAFGIFLALLTIPIGMARADTRQSNVTQCIMESGVPAVSAEPGRSVICLGKSGGIKWVR